MILSVLLTFIATSVVMFGRFDSYMKENVRSQAEYLKAVMGEAPEEYLREVSSVSPSSRFTLVDREGKVLFDSGTDPAGMENHADRPEFVQAREEGYGESLRFSRTLSRQTFYAAVLLDNGDMVRVGKTTESVFYTLFSGFTLLGVLVLGILLLEFHLVQKQTKELIEPINQLDLEHPLTNICYEELRPLLERVEEQNQQIARQVAELKEAEAMRREFSANVSHELKTPLMSISGYAELMMKGMVSGENIPEFSARIYQEASRLSSLVSDIIQLSRLDGKSADMPFETVDLCEIGEDVARHLKPAAEKKNLDLSFTGNSVTVNGVRQVLYEMFYNLADNGVRYTPEGGRVEIFVEERDGHALYRVRDNGIGIPKEEQERIFERFYRVDKSHSRETGGTGLGLSIVKHGAMLHQAEIRVESAPGEGTAMEIVF